MSALMSQINRFEKNIDELKEELSNIDDKYKTSKEKLDNLAEKNLPSINEKKKLNNTRHSLNKLSKSVSLAQENLLKNEEAFEALKVYSRDNPVQKNELGKPPIFEKMPWLNFIWDWITVIREWIADRREKNLTDKKENIDNTIKSLKKSFEKLLKSLKNPLSEEIKLQNDISENEKIQTKEISETAFQALSPTPESSIPIKEDIESQEIPATPPLPSTPLSSTPLSTPPLSPQSTKNSFWAEIPESSTQAQENSEPKTNIPQVLPQALSGTLATKTITESTSLPIPPDPQATIPESIRKGIILKKINTEPEESSNDKKAETESEIPNNAAGWMLKRMQGLPLENTKTPSTPPSTPWPEEQNSNCWIKEPATTASAESNLPPPEQKTEAEVKEALVLHTEITQENSSSKSILRDELEKRRLVTCESMENLDETPEDDNDESDSSATMRSRR